VEAAIMRRGIGYEGSRHVRAWAQLMSGPSSSLAYSMHPATSDRVIERGDLGILELGTHVDGYWSDLTRTLVAGGEPNSRQTELYDAVVAAVDAVLEKAAAGMTGGAVDALARKEISRRGLGEFFVHQTGHGLGFRYHEPLPTLHPDNQGLVRAGMVSSVEPGLYATGLGGMRLEENVMFTESGVELLSDFDRSLI
jgi:Xaa-Pro dipeptidase